MTLGSKAVVDSCKQGQPIFGTETRVLACGEAPSKSDHGSVATYSISGGNLVDFSLTGDN